MIISTNKKKIEKITLIEPSSAGSHIFTNYKIPRLGLPVVGAKIKEKGYKVKIYVEDIKPIDYNEAFSSDLVGISCTSSTVVRGYAIASEFKKRGIPIVMGGFHPTFMPEESLQYCDFVVRGEGEETIAELLDVLEGDRDIGTVDGLSFKTSEGEVINNAPRKILSSLDDSPLPDFTLIDGYEKINIFPLSTSRGCPFDCQFCTVTNFYGRSYRTKSIDRVMKEFANVKANYIFICDDNFAANRARTKELLERKEKEGNKVMWGAQVRIETADDTELLERMHRTNCSNVYIGFESINPETIKTFNKKLDLNKIKRQIKAFHRYGIKIHGMFVLGADSDTSATIKETLKFTKRTHIDTVQFMILTPIPGSKIFNDFQSRNKIFTYDWRLYDGHHVVYKPERMSPFELQKAVLRATKRFYSKRRIMLRLLKFDLFTTFGRSQGYKLFRQWMKENKKFLERIRTGLYDKIKSFDPVNSDSKDANLTIN
ncbi:MAG: radical SAM protein [Candidatus Schekmanbacteria bacterium]|nr:MAG: radical SAM protein [Candidatus Schekmanbacteria bacterium]